MKFPAALRPDAPWVARLASSRIADLFDVSRYGNRYAYGMTWLILAFCAVGIVWAALTRVDSITRGDGRFVPAQSVQRIQNLEGGILDKLLVREGDLVQKGQPLLHIDNTTSAAAYAEAQSRQRHLEATRQRLVAERDGQPTITFSAALQQDAPTQITAQTRLFISRKAQFEEQQETLRQQITQREKEIGEIRVRLDLARRNLALARKEYAVSKPLEAGGALSKRELIQIEARVNTLAGEASTLEISLPRTRAALAEARSRLRELQSSQHNEILKTLAEVSAELEGVEAILKLGQDRVTRTIVRSPATGIIKTIVTKTTGGVIKPGEDIIEIVPSEDTLMIEGRIPPADVAFLRPGLPAVVKVTAYDSGQYGALRGTVKHISADTITDERGFSYYKVMVSIRRDPNDRTPIARLPIMPGMTATVEIISGEKTILQYLLTPVLRIKQNAFTEH
jgi:adhesin transport system membrane fusion protein